MPQGARLSGHRIRLRLLIAAGVAAGAALLQAQIPSRNVNMVSGDSWPNGDPYLQRQNEPSLAASTRNPLHLLAGANDYRSVDLPGLPQGGETGDAWLGLFKSLDGGQRWTSTLLPGYPQDTSAVGRSSPIYGYQAAADAVVRPGPAGLFYFSGIVFDRTDNARSRVFVARFIDNNNKEAGDPVHYLGATAVASDSGATGAFIDKPWIAVDVPRAGAKTCTIDTPGEGAKRVTQRIPAGHVYIAYAVITDNAAGITGTIMFSRSVDCGVSWSAPIAISSPTDKVNQGAAIAVDPATGAVSVAWRKFGLGNENDAIVTTRTPAAATKFEKPTVLREFYAGRDLGQLIKSLVGNRKPKVKKKDAVAVEPPAAADPQIAPFDQKTLADSFRTNAYPTMAIDAQSRVYIAWAERGFRVTAPAPSAQQDASIVMTTGVGGANWTAPAAVEMHDNPGHQFMPSLAFAGGKLMLVYYDLREDVSGVFREQVDETSARVVASRRHTIDLRATQASPAATPAFAPSVRVSEYLYGSRRNSKVVEQMQFNPPNLPLFQLGEVPFMGDYVDLAAAPAMVQDASGAWQHNTAAGAAPVFHTAWTDNRDVKPPPDGDWANYTPPSGTQINSTFDPTKTVAACSPGRAGLRNQNVYTSRITAGLLTGSPGNSKPLDPDVPRAFVVFAQNTTSLMKAFRMSIASQPAGGRASFTQLESEGLVTFVDVITPPRSTVSKSVFVTSSDPHAKVAVGVVEIAAVGAPLPLPDGLASAVLLNPDISNPDISNPDISNPDISNPDISNAEVYNPDISNPDISNPDISNPDISNPDISNPDISNVVILNPDISNPDISNPDISNPDISNPDISNPDISNPDISNGSLTDVTWTVTNRGNTTSNYDVNMLASLSVPNGIKTQLIIHKTYTTPVSDGCTLKYTTQTVLVTSIANPDISNPDISNPDISNASLWLEPGAEGKITLRILDPDPRDAVTFNPLEGTTPVEPQIESTAVNTPQLGDPDPEPPAATPPTVSSTAISVVTQPADALVTASLGPVQVRVVRTVDGVTSGLAGASVAAGILTNPGGGQLAGPSTVLTDVNGFATLSGLSIDRPGSGYQLAFTAAAAEALPISSALFNISIPAAADPAQNVFVVTTTADAGPGSLRQAMLDANATPNGPLPDLIAFGFRLPIVQLVSLATPLPALTQAVIIDGTTQSGYNSLNGQPLIHVSGSALPASSSGFQFAAGSGGSTIRGLSITGLGTPATPSTTPAILVLDGPIAIQANWIGIAPDGTPLGNQTGIRLLGGAGSSIGGTNGAATRNIISAGRTGIFASAGTATTILGNFIGTSPDGLTARSNTVFGITLQTPAVTNTVIGGPVAAGGYFAAGSPANLISANLAGGISLQDVAAGGPLNTQILGNVVGLAIDGTDLGNNGGGIRVRGSSNTLVGAPGAGNVVSGNGVIAPFATGNGIAVEIGPSGAPAVPPRIQSNIVGLDPSGLLARPNVYAGVLLNIRAVVGGTGPGEGNLIAGNGDQATASGTGVNVLEGAGGTVIQGNTIGLNAAGAALGNGYSGITVFGTSGGATPPGGATIGGNLAVTPLARNVISGNPNAGIAVYTVGVVAAPKDVVVKGNYIGTDASGAVAGVGNGMFGISLGNGDGHIIGGDTLAEGNVIAGNGTLSSGAGVTVGNNARRVDIRSNSIFGNSGLGINLGSALGVLANDAGDGDLGANDQQNYPIVGARVNAFSGAGYIRVRLDTNPGVYKVQIFTNSACDASGNGEGQTFLLESSITVAGTPAEAILETSLIAPGQVLTATATDSAGNTSEFSTCITVATTNAFYWSPSAGGNGHFYEYVLGAITDWNVARTTAAGLSVFARPGHLVSITSGAENTFVAGLKTGMGLPDLRAWIGLRDTSGTGSWAWVTGEPYVFANTFWDAGTGEPNNIGSELYVEFLGSASAWNNRVDGGGAFPIQGYVVEYEF